MLTFSRQKTTYDFFPLTYHCQHYNLNACPISTFTKMSHTEFVIVRCKSRYNY